MKKVEHILLIDDDETDNVFHEIIIREAGVDAAISTFTDSRKALKYLKDIITGLEQSQLPDLIFLDINMPAVNGFELLEELIKLPDPHNRKGNLVIFMLTTSEPYFYKAEMAKCKNLLKGYYTKPLSEKILLEILIEHF